MEDYQINFNHIKGKNKILADTLSRLITVDPEVKLNPEFANYEFGTYCLEELPKAKTKTDQKLGNTREKFKINKIKVVYNEEIDHKSYTICVYLPLCNENLINVQGKDTQISKIPK